MTIAGIAPAAAGALVGASLVGAAAAGALVGASVGSGCAVTGGRWVSLYDGVEVVEPSRLDIDHVVRVVKVVVFVAGAPGFTGHAQVGNGASEALQEIFGEAGRHARSAVGVASLPLGAPVEVELVVAVASAPASHLV